MIYRALLKDDFEKLPPVLRTFHSALGERRAHGEAMVRRRNALLARLTGFPPEGDRIPMRLEVSAKEDQEIWTRWFGGLSLSSTQRVAGALLVERMGPLRIGFRISVREGRMEFESRTARIWGIPAPVRVQACATGGDSSWKVEVNVAHVGSYCAVMTIER